MNAITEQKPPAMLGVERSASGKRWEARPDEARLTAALARATGSGRS